MKVWELLVVLIITIYLAYTFIIFIRYVKSRNIGNKTTFLSHTTDAWEIMTIFISIGIIFAILNYLHDNPDILTREIF